MLKANGKYIDTMPVQQLFSQEEARADVVTIEVDRFHGSLDLSEFLFVMRGITESGGETEAVLHKTVEEEVIRLSWEVGPKFTAEPGVLALDLFAYRYEEDGDPAEDAPDYLLRYQLPPVHVRALPDGTHKLDEQSYTAFLIEVREAVAKALEDIGSASGEVHTELERMNSVVEYLHTAVMEAVIPEMQEIQEDVLQLKLKDSGTPIVVLSQSEYSALEEKDEGTLYVIR